ncbi:hypothetical protein [Kocuria sp. HSID16901]|uniref:hypothetical protein n=1 Tax=Kocuria sp. HSID16901 TaxID=2419505 RepID=UPI000A72780B|nr:hypothetical protein [Kocuria sp. HSID16901]RUQ20893.1 hypothetical protein D8M21_08300 [Kocuria sp. HSID16901]
MGSEQAQNTALSYKYDDQGQMTSKSLDALESTFSYTPGGVLQRLGYTEGETQKSVSFGTDDHGRRTDIWYGANTVPNNKDWAVWKHSDYDKSGNIVRQTVKQAGAVAATPGNLGGIQTISQAQYCYIPKIKPRDCGTATGNAVDKVQSVYTLTAGTNTGFATYYSYDARGNRIKTEHTIGSNPATVDTDTFNAQNQTTSDGWTYDADGNLTSSEKADSTYNSVGQNTKTTLKDGSNTTQNVYAGGYAEADVGTNLVEERLLCLFIRFG